MGRFDIYYYMKLDPPPEFVCIRNSYQETGTVWYSESREPNKIFINSIQTGTIQDLWEDGFEQTLTTGDIYVDVGGAHKRQELLAPLHEICLRISAAEAPAVLTAHEVATRPIVTHEVLLPGRIADPDIAKKVTGMILAADLNAPPGDELRSMKLRTSMYEILLVLTRCAIDQARRQLQQNEKKWSRSTTLAVLYIKEHLSEKLSVETVAQASKDNYNHLKTVFRREVGMTMVEYINYLRIQKTKELIAQQVCTAEAAGEAVGIHDVKYLRRLFRRYTGMTILEYRRVCREANHTKT